MKQMQKTSTLKSQPSEWFIIVEQKQEGPFKIGDLKRDPRFTPDTLVWRKGFTEWTPARFVPELQDLFKDGNTSPKDGDTSPNVQDPDRTNLSPGQAILILQQDPYPFLLWLLLFLLIVLYTLYQIYEP